MMWPFKKAEVRGNVHDPNVPVSATDILQFFGINGVSSAGETVTIDTALGVPSVWAAVNFLSGTLAGLPLHVYKKTNGGRERVSSPLATLLHDQVNDDLVSSFEWRKHTFDQVFTGGRGLSFVERNRAGRVSGIWPLDPTAASVKRVNGRRIYEYNENGATKRYEAAEIIDIPFMLKSDMVQHRSPLMANKEAIGLAQAVTKHGGTFFSNGGVPPFVVTGGFQSGAAMTRAANDLDEAVKKAAKEDRQALVLPNGLEIKALGVDADKMQLVETQRFCVEQIARIYSIPPTFLQDLTHGTFSNTEQQDLHFVKHTLRRWVEQFEQELNLKLLGRQTDVYIEMSVDGLLRGDFGTRMEGYQKAVNSGILKPSEARERENLPAAEGADGLFMQGAMLPISALGQSEGET